MRNVRWYAFRMDVIAERLKSARIAAGYETAKAATERFGWTFTTYAGHENGSRGIKQETILEYARAFRVTPEWLMFGRGADGALPEVPPAGHDLVPVYNVQASAGNGSQVDAEYVVERLAFPPDYLRRITKANPKDLAIIGVKGDSMLPTLKDDDVVMVDLGKRDLSWGGIFVIRVDGDGLLVKRVSMGSQRGMFKIVSDNAAAFPAVERHAEDVEVIGRVVWYGVKV